MTEALRGSRLASAIPLGVTLVIATDRYRVEARDAYGAVSEAMVEVTAVGVEP